MTPEEKKEILTAVAVIKKEEVYLPSINEVYGEDLSLMQKADNLMVLLNQPPKPEWVKEHPIIKGYRYIPIARIESLLKKIFKLYKIEITGQGTAFNGVWVTVRVHYFNPVVGEWMFHDGIGAAQLQTKKDTAPSDLININNGAIAMAFPIAKTVAVKDACDHFGNLFGADLNRKEVIGYQIDKTLIKMSTNHPNWSKMCEALVNGTQTIEAVKKTYQFSEDAEEFIENLIKSKENGKEDSAKV